VDAGGTLSASASADRGSGSINSEFDLSGENTATYTSNDGPQGGAKITVLVSLIRPKSVDIDVGGEVISSDQANPEGVVCRGTANVTLSGPLPPPPPEENPAEPPQPAEPPKPEVKQPEPPQPETKPVEVKPEPPQPAEPPKVQPRAPAVKGGKMKRKLLDLILAAIQKGKGPEDLPNWDKLSPEKQAKVKKVFTLTYTIYMYIKSREK
jgi:hypothetical protein